MVVELDFVRKGILRYSEKTKEIVGLALPMESKEEAVERIVADIISEKDIRKLKEKLDVLLDKHLVGNLDSTFSRTESPDALEEVRKRLELERTRVIKQLETLATREKDEKAQQEEVMKSNQRREYINRLSESRAALTKEAFDAGFKSLLEYLLFLEIVETHMSHDNGNAPVCSFDYRDKYII